MGIFDFFKKNSTNHAHEEILHPDEKLVFKEIKLPERTSKPAPYLWAYYKKEEPNDYEGYFKNGGLYNVKPRNKRISLYEDRGVAYCARYIISDGIKYDLEGPDSIASMKIPVFDDIHGMPNTTSDLGYIMKVRANAENRPVLAVPLVYKAANLMMASPIWWQKKDYYQIIKHLWLIGEIDYADHLLEELDKRGIFIEPVKTEFSGYHDKESPYYKSDLVDSNDEAFVCSECAKYVKRRFSEYGYNKKYPKLPDYIKENREEHKYCCITFSPVLEDISIPAWDYTGDLIKFSNRPFVDNRTEEQKKQFEEHKARRIQKEKAEERYYSRDYWIEKYKKHLEYQQVVEIMGEKAPKSYSGYQRMKKNNTANFQKILKAAEEHNIKINQDSVLQKVVLNSSGC